MKSQSGFTLIELVVVIVVLGILAAVAVPKFIDVKQDAAESALKGFAGALASANALNYAKANVNKANATEVLDCDESGALLQVALPAEYTITSAAIADNASATCTLTSSLITTNNTATFVAFGVDVP